MEELPLFRETCRSSWRTRSSSATLDSRNCSTRAISSPRDSSSNPDTAQDHHISQPTHHTRHAEDQTTDLNAYLQATADELAEVAGWLLYDADRQDDVRRMNQEALYFSRLAGDRRMELLTLQNASMHAGHLGRSREALQLAHLVLESRDRLSPRVRTLFLVRKARALAQGGDENALRLFNQVRSHYEDGVRENDPKWAWWVDERELAWHEGMALIDLGRPREAVDKFQQSVWGKTAHQMRGRYLHLGYLLSAQVQLGAWKDAETTMRQIATMVRDVSSTRTVVLLTAILPKLRHERVPASTRDTAEQLALLLSQAST